MSDEETFDVVELTKANSAQLNAVDLVGGPATVRILGVKNNNSADGKQPIKVLIDGGFKPWFPCLTMRRMMIGKWGNPAKWPGRSVTIYNDPAVTYGKNKTGGVRVSHMSNLPEPFDVTLPTRRNEYTTYTIRPLATQTAAPDRRPAAPQSEFDKWAAAVRQYLNLDPDAVSEWFAATGRGDLTTKGPDVLKPLYEGLDGGADLASFRSSPFGGAS
jgi:hypothetical protein